MKTLHVTEAKTFWQSVRGLIGYKHPKELLLKTRWGIHTFGVFFPIDILIINDQYRVMRLKKSLHPNRIFFWPPKWAIVVELPTGTIAQKNIRIGDQLKIILSS
ncbi:MAG: DUF192 domain-containing protein [Candidatus Levybacteria bacterium]|nr:DUF192 domain-containing protein [Candidatus Levybacteria bacterium]